MRIEHLAPVLCLALTLGCGGSSGPAPQGEGTPADQAKAAAPDKGEAAPAAKPPAPENIDLQGAGATFPFPLYSKWVSEYQKVDPRVRINYQSIGSGGGIRQITAKTVDFGASDAPMNAEELAKMPGPVVHIPTTLGAVVVAYNLPGVSELKLSPEVLTGVFLGDIKTWNDKKLAALNPGVKLPKDPIAVAYRSDGSGTTAVFTEYLSKVSPSWKTKVGAGKSVKFPVGMGAKGNEGVAGQLKTSPGTIGYVELAYAKQTNLTYASIRNQAGKFVAPALEGISAAAASVVASMPDDLRVSIVDAPGEATYPISAFTYVLLYQDQADATKGKALAQFLWWAVHEGESFGPALSYAPLPPEVVTKVEAKLRALRAGGQALLPSS
jgi:phosphate transport system substrate-binding protein